MLGICGGSFRARLTSRFSQLPLASRLKFEKYPSFTHFTMMSSTSQGIILRAPQMPDPENTILMLCDVQDRFGQLIPNMKRIVASSTMLMNTAHELKMAVICTEQYPKVFGKTVKELASDKNKIVEKFKFSMCCNEVSEYIDKLDPKPKNVILTGMETHVCVLQTCFDLINKGYNIHLCIDATGSQRDLDKQVAIRVLLIFIFHPINN